MDLKDIVGKVLADNQVQEVAKTKGADTDIMNLIKKGLKDTDFDLDVADATKVADVKVVKEGQTVGNLSDIVKDVLSDGKVEMDEVISAVKTVITDDKK